MRRKFWMRLMRLEHWFNVWVDPDHRRWWWLSDITDDLNDWLSDRWYDAVLREDRKKVKHEA